MFTYLIKLMHLGKKSPKSRKIYGTTDEAKFPSHSPHLASPGELPAASLVYFGWAGTWPYG